MPWFKVDDRFHSHIKVHRLPMAARGLWVTAGSWCASQLTDGFVPRKLVVVLGARQRDAEALVDAKLWTQVDGGYRFNSWLDYQPSKEEWEAKRQGNAARVAAHRAKKSPESRQDSSKILPKSRQNPSKGLAEVWQPEPSDSAVLAPCVTHYSGISNALPTRPDPIREEAAASSLPAAAGPSAHENQIRGFRFVASLLGRSTFDIAPLGSFQAEYGHIGGKPDAEHATVAKAVNADEWCRANPSRVDAPHLQRTWQKYLAGPVKQIVRAVPPPAAAPAPLAHQLMKF
jgi:hypothetical protein